MKTQKIYLDDNSPFIYGFVIALSLVLVFIANRVTATANIRYKLETCRESVVKQSAMLEVCSPVVKNMVEWAEDYPSSLLRFYRLVNDSRILGKPMR